MKPLTDEDYATLIRWAEVFHTVDGRLDKLRERYTKPPELFVVELDDPGTFPTPTWGPFDQLTDAMNFVVGRLSDDHHDDYTVTDLEQGSVLYSYRIDVGVYYHIKRLQPPR